MRSSCFAFVSIVLLLPSLGQARDAALSVQVAEAWRQCSSNADCVSVDTLCSYCCGMDAIAKTHLPAFKAARLKICNDSIGAIGSACNCVPEPGEPRCVRGACRMTR